MPYMYRMKHRTLFTAFAAAAIAAAGAASAKDSAKSAPRALPGVDSGYSIVGPASEPEGPVVAENGDRIFKAGNTEIRIGGYVRVDIGTGALRPGN
jgi:hypothetical protein